MLQCLLDFDIPLLLNHTVTEVRGKDRVEQVVAMRTDARRNTVPGTEIVFDCDTLLLSIGLIPENELTRGAGIPIDRRTNGAVVYENGETEPPASSPAATCSRCTISWITSPRRASAPDGPRRSTSCGRSPAGETLSLARAPT